MTNTYPEPYRSATKDTLVDPSTCYNRECVSYVAWKIAEAVGKWLRRTGDMSAKYWVNRLPENGYRRVSAPKDGGKYVGVLTGGTYGHVVWFEGGTLISEYNYNYSGEYSERNINISSYIWFEIAAPPVVVAPKQDQTVPTTTSNAGSGSVPNNPRASDLLDIRVGDSVIAWGVGTADSDGGGSTTGDFPDTTMKVIGINNGRYALNQYNQGTPGNVIDTTGWWPSSQVRKK